MPADGASWRGGPVTFTFDQPMAPSSADNLSIEPAIAGATRITGTQIVFTPAAAPLPGTRYQFTFAPGAAAVSGAALNAPVSISLAAAVPLTVTATQPDNDAQDVGTNGQIVIIFNRPVVPLTGAADQSKLPQPLSLDPPVEGQGKWLNTSVYAFQPKLGLAGAQTYKATVSDITGISGETLAAPYTFRFTTAAPAVTGVAPANGPIAPETMFQVTFSQPMDTQTTEAAFSLHKVGTAAGAKVQGAITWNADNTILTFTPAQPLDFGGNYAVGISKTAQPASRQGNLREDFSQSLVVVPLPAVEAVTPINAAVGASPEQSVVVRFNTFVSPTLALANIHVAPALTSTTVYSYYSYYNNEVQLSWSKEPNTQYTITVGAAIADQYGNTLGKDYVFSFTTGDYSPYVKLELEHFTHFSAFTKTHVSLLFRNVDKIGVDLFKLPESELFKLAGSNQYQAWQNYKIPNRAANRIWSRTYQGVEEKNVAIRQVVSLTNKAGQVLAPGVYLLEITQPKPPVDDQGNIADHSQAVIVLSNDNLVIKKSQLGGSLAWLTDLATGEPVAGRKIRFYSDGKLLSQGTTAADGTVTATLTLDPNQQWAPVLAVSGAPGDPQYTVTSSDWNSGIAVYDFNLNGGPSSNTYQSYFYTDRPIYRPGQTVYWKGIIRALKNDQYTLPPAGLPITVTVRDDRGNPVLAQQFTVDQYGVIDGKVELAAEAVTGYYYLEALIPIGKDQTAYSGVGFQVASYQKPEFEIAVKSDKPEYIQGDTISVTVNANYFSGGPLADAAVTWRLISSPYTFNWDGAPHGRYYSFTPYDPKQLIYDPYANTAAMGLIREGAGQTMANGSFILTLPADISQAVQSQNWTIDFTVQSSTNQFVSGSVTVPVHRAQYYVGLSPQSYVSRVGADSNIDIVSITPQAKRYLGAKLQMVVSEFEWNSVYQRAADGSYHWDTSVQRTPILTQTLTTDHQGAATLTWTPRKAGQYQVVATGQDEAGNPVSSSVMVWISSASSSDFVAWPRNNNDRIELVADKSLYAPGDTAHVLVPSPFTGPVRALLTLERGGVLESHVVTLTGNSQTLDIPITADHIPNIYVGVVLVKGVDGSNPTPAMRVGYVQLAVDTSSKQLSIDIQPSAPTVRPGTTVSYTITVRDDTGAPVPNTDLSVALVDKAVLTLASGDNRSMIDVFYYKRSLDVTTGALLVINQDRQSQQLSEGAKGGGGGGGGGLEIRQNFPDIAYWRANLTTDDMGEVHFTVDLPDNLTTWRLVAKAVTADTKVGDATNDIMATKELQVRSLLPRFFTAGDRAKIGASVINASQQDLTSGVLTVSMSGAHIEGSAAPSTTFALAVGAQTLQSWPIAVDPEANTVVVTFTAQGTASARPNLTLRDGVRITLPVMRYTSPETVATSGVVPPEGTVEAIRLPAAATRDGNLQVTIDPSLAGGMIDGLTYLSHYPYECNEQTVSRFLPNLFTVRALKQLNIDDPQLQSDLSYQLGIAVQRLTGRQNSDGGWGYWPGEDSSPFITAYVLWGLASANEMGYTVPQNSLTNATNYLDRQFQAPKDVKSTAQLNEMAFMNYVLADMGQGDPGRASTLFDARERLGIYGKAFLALTLDATKQGTNPDPRVQALIGDLIGAAKITATGASWQEDSIDYRNLNTNTRTTAIVLDALVRLQPNQPLLPQVVRWLMEARRDGHWSNTQESSWSIIALTDWLRASGELQANYDWHVTLNGNRLGSGSVTAKNLTEQVQLRAQISDLLRDQANQLVLSRSNGSGQMYYTTQLRYYLDATAIDALDRGVVVDRRFSLPDGGQPSVVNAAAVGDVISVTVTIVAPTDLYHLLVEAPIPAGTEPIDASLATTSQQFGSPQLQQTGQQSNQLNWWRYWQPTYTDIRDDKVALFATFLRAGTYEYTFLVRATVPGEYRVLPVHAEEMYFTDVWGRSAGSLFTVKQ